ncbi:hypothetical protein SALBM217S_09050 [Streptomyces griseoloalbus]
MQMDPRCGVRRLQQGVRDTERSQDLQGPRVHDERAGGPELLEAPLNDPDPCSVGVGLQGQAEAGRAGPDDQDVHRRGHVPATVRHHAAASGSGSSTSRGSAITSSRRTPGTIAYRIEPGSLTSARTRHRERA